MAECYSYDEPNIALTAATAKTVMILTAGSTDTFRLIQANIGCDATSTGLLKVEFALGTLTSGTAGTAPNKSRMNGESWNRAPNTTATGGYTAEPTYTKHASNDALVIATFLVPLPATPLILQEPLGREFYCPASNSLILRLTSTTVSPNSYCTLHIEE